MGCQLAKKITPLSLPEGIQPNGRLKSGHYIVIEGSHKFSHGNFNMGPFYFFLRFIPGLAQVVPGNTRIAPHVGKAGQPVGWVGVAQFGHDEDLALAVGLYKAE